MFKKQVYTRAENRIIQRMPEKEMFDFLKSRSDDSCAALCASTYESAGMDELSAADFVESFITAVEKIHDGNIKVNKERLRDLARDLQPLEEDTEPEEWWIE